MTLTNRDAANRANLGSLSDLFRRIKLGDLLEGQIPQQLRAQDPAANAGNLAVVEALALPDHSKAGAIVAAYVRAGGVTGSLTPVALDATPATTQVAVAPNGNIVVLAADLITSLDIIYQPVRGDVVEAVFPVVADVLTLPASITGRNVILIEEVEALVGTTTGVKRVLTPGGAPAAGEAALISTAKLTVTFAAADAVTRARVKLLVGPGAADLQTVLEAVDNLI